jgi:DNA invertase Pin-like site-specific DNA recombinase
VKAPNVEAPKPLDVLSPWRDALLALLKPEETDHARSFNAGIHAALALLTQHEQDRQLRSRSAIKQRKVDGKKNGGDVPYGYRLAEDGETLLEKPDEQAVIVKVRGLRPNHSLRAIARKLKEARLFPRSYDPKDPKSPREFQAVQIQRMLDQMK